MVFRERTTQQADQSFLVEAWICEDGNHYCRSYRVPMLIENGQHTTDHKIEFVEACTQDCLPLIRAFA